jgi:hypothetical protein
VEQLSLQNNYRYPKFRKPIVLLGQFFEVSSFSDSVRWGSIADRAVPSAATPAATAACLATRISFGVLGRLDFFDFAGRSLFVCLRVDLAATRFGLVFDLTRRSDEVFDLARFFAFFMFPPFDSIYQHWPSNLLLVKRFGMEFGPANEEGEQRFALRFDITPPGP